MGVTVPISPRRGLLLTLDRRSRCAPFEAKGSSVTTETRRRAIEVAAALSLLLAISGIVVGWTAATGAEWSLDPYWPWELQWGEEHGITVHVGKQDEGF